jgi:hypothetical protein
MERKSYLHLYSLFCRTDATPCRSGLHFLRIARCKKHLKFVRFQTLRSRSVLRPKFELPGRKTFLRQPESLAIIRKTFNRRPPAVSKNKQAAGKRILLQYRFTNPGKPIDPVSEINRFHRHQDPHLRGDLDHCRVLQNRLLRAFRSGVPVPLRWIRIFAPFRASSSMVHSAVGSDTAGLSSMKGTAVCTTPHASNRFLRA